MLLTNTSFSGTATIDPGFLTYTDSLAQKKIFNNLFQRVSKGPSDFSITIRPTVIEDLTVFGRTIEQFIPKRLPKWFIEINKGEKPLLIKLFFKGREGLISVGGIGSIDFLYNAIDDVITNIRG